MATSWISSFVSHPIGARIVYYPTLLYGILRQTENRHWYDRIDEKVILGALPVHKIANEIVQKENVCGVVTLNEEYETRYICPTPKEWSAMNVKQLRIPTVDFNNAPTLEQIDKSLTFIDQIEHGKSVYVHCKAGRSRSSVVVLCYVIQKYGLDVNSAIDMVRTKRPHIVLGSEHKRMLSEFHEMKS